MFARLFSRRKAVANLFAVLCLGVLSACSLPAVVGGGDGPSIDASQPVPVALLVPAGSGQASDALIATNLENAARLAVADLQGAQIDLRVYPTGGSPSQAICESSQCVCSGTH